ncbi:hypothetical protein NA57DRAFT_73858 [Rhizodiscina lignyota]|uniref:Zn(2)-C6 fungal-type domain-containing protein n=1 Tax=Rhizodiscina lignyota TaxID=1504668 RepID=A0A9P4IHS9_9PEZI|nr:hypothetical protein NA57DRAFT_73858 [Rhizodiscina lignyota]
MPGVPSGRGCEACRKQKKKCDQGKPSCSRCTRLQIPCIGSGERRYQFKEQRPFGSHSPSEGSSSAATSRSHSDNKVERVRRSPSNEVDSLSIAFGDMIKASTDLRYNLAWSFGDYLEEIPRRLGTNQALDTSAAALVEAHSVLCSRGDVTAGALDKYSLALSKLREYLDDPAKAGAPETICSVYLLLISQSFIGFTGGRFTGHSEGAAQILKARRNFAMRDDFEKKLFLSLRATVLLEGLVNSKIDFTFEEWKVLVEDYWQQEKTASIALRCLCRVPSYMHRGKAVLSGQIEDPELLDEMTENYQTLKTALKDFQAERLEFIQSGAGDKISPFAPVRRNHAQFERQYGLILAISIILNIVLSVIDITNMSLSTELLFFSKEILTLVEPAEKYRPLGACSIPFFVCMAWMGSTDSSIRSSVEMTLADYHQDFFRGHDMPTIIRELHLTEQQLHLQDPDPPWDGESRY